MELYADGGTFHLKSAKEKDLQVVLQLLIQAATWLQTKGTTQWDYYLTHLEENTQEILDSILKGNTYILLKENKAIATITLEDQPTEWDTDIWGQARNNNNIVYLHRIVVHREYAGKQIGEKLIEWAVQLVKGQGKQYIRFDCLRSNKGLNTYYQRKYELKGIANIYGEHCKYEIVV
ncbi:GNAT family N-acetyltransferase [Cytobacillus sp. IB215316]|uniref:GNAT family N-acetyltransferase n=1 Tax=Cytobacillus sp. IB215316 TaxID=3097354 RepID=UPI002A126316|nr:GNAT family N-acetyltransferase [Cytobacillus sp. IB215316]MDX8361492.1 GNAT family N-acetyltransferase [Cytobacillus sp. IB215316]